MIPGSRQYAKLAEKQREWVRKNERTMRLAASEALRSWMSTRRGFFPHGEASQYASWLSITGSLAVLDSNPAGWGAIHDACVLEAGLAVAELKLGRRVSMVEFCPALAGLLAMGDLPRARRLRDAVSLARERGVDCGWTWSALPDAVLWLANRLDGKECSFVGQYDEHDSKCLLELLDAWEQGGEALASPLARVCDYHLKRAQSTKVSAEFVFGGYPICPVEVAAFRAQRRRENRSRVDIDHAVALSQLASPPNQAIVDVVDALVAELGRRPECTL